MRDLYPIKRYLLKPNITIIIISSSSSRTVSSNTARYKSQLVGSPVYSDKTYGNIHVTVISYVLSHPQPGIDF